MGNSRDRMDETARELSKQEPTDEGKANKHGSRAAENLAELKKIPVIDRTEGNNDAIRAYEKALLKPEQKKT
jgi:hypothetical protein